MKIKDIDINFDFLDADNMEKFEIEAKKVIEECDKKRNENITSYSEMIRSQCKVINNFIDNVFGKGVSEKIFEGKNNLKEHIEIFKEIVDEKNTEQNDLMDDLKKYQPNRGNKRRR